MNNNETNIIESDLLVIGGGIGGCCAAIKAAEHGLKVTLVEKSKTERSGNASQGIDHYSGFVPDDTTPEKFREMIKQLGSGALFGAADYADPTMLYKTVVNRKWAAEELERIGVPMKWENGDYHIIDTTSHGVGGGLSTLRVHWHNVKPILGREVRKRGVNVFDRTMALDLLTNKDTVVGATAFNTRTGQFLVFKAKAVIIATASFSRLYNPETPLPWKYKYRYHWCPATISGDGWAMAYRAGAELANMEQSKRGYRLHDDLTLSFGNVRGDGIESKTITWDGLEISHVSEEMESKGKLPFYYSFEHMPDDYMKRIEVAYADERLVSFKIAEDRHFDPRTHRYEIVENKPIDLLAAPGIAVDSDYRATLTGLYAVGDCVAGLHTVASAAVSGLLLGDDLDNFVNKAENPVINEEQVLRHKEAAFSPLSIKEGTQPTELECAIRYDCDRYIGSNKSEGKLREGLRRLGSLKREFLPKISASNPHYLMRCLEVRNILELAEVHMQACLERKETRDAFTRSDYTQKDARFDNLLLHQRLEGGKATVLWKKIKPVKLEAREHR